MASVWGGIAAARGSTTFGSSFLRGLAEALKEKRQQEYELQRMREQLDMQKQLQENTFKQGLIQAAYSRVLEGVSQGTMTAEDAQRALSGIVGGFDLPGGVDLVSSIAGFAAASKKAADEASGLKFAQWLASQGVPQDVAAEAANRWAQGDKEGAALLVGMSAADLEARAKEAGVELTKARVQGEKARTQATLTEDEIRRFELEKGRAMLPYEMKILKEKANWIGEQLRTEVEQTVAQTEGIKANTELTKKRTEQVLQQIKFDALANPIRLEIMQTDSDYRKKQIELAEAKLAGDWERVKQLEIETASDTLDFLKKQAMQGLEVRASALGELMTVAKNNAEAADKFYQQNKELFDKLGVDETLALAIVKPEKQLQTYGSPKMNLALDTVTQLAANPPAPEERASAIKDAEKQLRNAGLDETEIKNLLRLMENSWYSADARLELEREKLRIQSGNGSKDWLEAKLKALTAQSTALKRAADSINQMRNNSPCFSLNDAGQYILNPDLQHTFPDGRSVDCKTYGEALAAEAERINGLLLTNAQEMGKLFNLGVFTTDDVITTAQELADKIDTQAASDKQPKDAVPGVDYPVTPDSFNSPADQMEKAALDAIGAWAEGRISRGFDVTEAEFRRRLKAAAPGMDESIINLAVQIAKEKGLITK